MIYIDLKKLINRPSVFKMALSQRGDGKSTEIKTAGLETFFQTGKAGVFVRRYYSEIESEEFLRTFWTNVERAHPELLRGRSTKCGGSRKRGYHAIISGADNDTSEWHSVFDILPLSVAGRRKSAFDYETHKNLYFDEYIPLDNSYLPDEITKIIELFQTIDRGHDDNFMLICGNKISRFNPIFEKFGVTRWKSGINTYKDGQFDLLIRKNGANESAAKMSRLGKLMSGTDYEEYNAGEFLIKFDELVNPSHSRILLLKIAHKGRLYGAYQGAKCIVIDRLSPRDALKNVVCVCVTPQEQRTGAQWLTTAVGAREILRRHKYNNALFFADELVLNELKKFYDKIV